MPEWSGMSERTRRLNLAVSFSIISKIVRFLTQTLIVGATIRYLGAESYGVWLTAVAALGWLSWGQAGLAPGLVNALAAADGENRRVDQGIYFSTALAIILSVALALAIAGQALIQWGGPWLGILISAAGEGSTADNTQWIAFLQASFALAILRLPLGLVESAFAGLQKIHVLRIFDVIGQLFCLASVFVLIFGGVPGAVLLLGIGLATEFGILAAGVYLVTRLRPELMPMPKKVKFQASSRMLNLSGGYLVIQVAGYLVAQGGILALASSYGTAAVPLFALTWQLYQMASGIWMMVMASLWGALGEAQSKGDWQWIRSSVTRLLYGTMALSIVFSLALAMLGPWIVGLWSGGEVTGGRTFFVVMALYCSVFTWGVIHAQILSALSIVWEQLWAALTKGVLVMVCALLFIPSLGVIGLPIALLFASLVTTAWVYPRLVKRRIREKTDVTTQPN
jgi:O-antigen/teichoic acid export membrane protein